MAAPAQLNSTDHRSDLVTSMCDRYNRKQLCDVTLCVTDPQSNDQVHSIECHKLILVSASQYFEDMLLSNEDSSNINMIDVGKGKLDVAEEVMSFLYTGRCKVTSENILELLQYSVSWKLKNLERLVTELVPRYLTIGNVVEIHEFATKVANEDVQQEASIFLRKRFTDVIKSAQFKHMSFTSLCSLLKSDEISVDSEDTILKALLVWLECNPCTESEKNDLWSAIKFQHLTAQYLLQEVLDHPLIQGEPQRGLVKQAITRLCANENLTTFEVIPRYWGTKPVYDRLAKITTDKKICVYDNCKKEWQHVGKVPQWVDKGTQCFVTKYDVVLLGAYEKSHKGKCLIIDLNRLMLSSELPDCNGELRFSGVARAGNTVYVVGGICPNEYPAVSKEVKQLNIEQATNKWEAIDPLLEGVWYPLVFVHKHLIFVIGGWTNGCKQSSLNQIYDINQSKWSLGASTPKHCDIGQNGGFVISEQIHIFTEEHHMIYNIDTDSWTCTQYNNVGFHIQPVLHGDEILACVRATSIFRSEASDFVCKSYDKEKKQWTDVGIDLKDCLMHKFFFSFKE